MLQIYHGNGKGKTTASVGLAVRAAGAGMNVMFMQFLKNGKSSEINVLKNINGITVMCCDVCNKFTFQMNENEINETASRHNFMLESAFKALSEHKTDMVILDEFLDAYNKKMLDGSLSEKLIFTFSDTSEIILTGRSPDKIFTDRADYISLITSEKHPFDIGVKARYGIEC